MKLAVDGLPTLAEVLASHNLHPNKSLGQNFLLDLSLTSKIARCAGLLNTGTVIEVGPGPGGLSRALLLEGAGELIAIEKDCRFYTALAQIAEHYEGRFSVIEEDVLQIDVSRLGKEPRQIVANLPYNIATVLLLKWLVTIYQTPKAITKMTLMFQKEVAMRICAQPGSSAYGRLSLLCQWLCDCEILFDISPKAFTPSPKVASALVKIRPLMQPRYRASLEALQQVSGAAFGQRRKMLRQSLKALCVHKDISASALCESANLQPTARAETVDLQGFCRLARCYAQL